MYVSDMEREKMSYSTARNEWVVDTINKLGADIDKAVEALDASRRAKIESDAKVEALTSLRDELFKMYVD